MTNLREAMAMSCAVILFDVFIFGVVAIALIAMGVFLAYHPEAWGWYPW